LYLLGSRGQTCGFGVFRHHREVRRSPDFAAAAPAPDQAYVDSHRARLYAV
jgi:hypothetical protein